MGKKIKAYRIMVGENLRESGHMEEVCIHGKGKVHPRTGHEGPQMERRYSSTLSLTSALDDEWVVNASPQLLYRPERDPVPIV
jgi:hypothetical protein